MLERERERSTRLCCAWILACPPPCSAALLLLSILSWTDSWPELLHCVLWTSLHPDKAAQLWGTCVKVFKELFRPLKIPPLLRMSVYAAILTSRHSPRRVLYFPRAVTLGMRGRRLTSQLRVGILRAWRHSEISVMTSSRRQREPTSKVLT